MNQLLTDGRALEGIVSSIIRQGTLHVAYSRLDWERMYRIADYHKVANIVYLGILGNGDAVPEKWKTRFFERYQESLLFGEHYKESVKEVLTWLDTRNISCIVLTSEVIREFYHVPEVADTAPLQLYMDTRSYELARGYLIDLGYEVDQVYEEAGEHFQRNSDLSITLYYKLPFRTAKYAKGMQKLLESACMRESYKCIRAFSVENEFVYRMAAAAYHYVTDELTMRELLELQLYHNVLRENIRMDVVSRRLAEFDVEELAEKILRLSYMWFADRKDPYYDGLPENMPEYDILEERLITRGITNHETDSQALGLERLIRKELDQEKKAERFQELKKKIRERWERIKRTIRWVFPDYRYMVSIYVVLEKAPVLLPIFWVVRDVRLLGRLIRK